MRYFILLLLLPWFELCSAQTWEEWFKQKETQKKYLLQQISALKVYLDYAAEGYKMANGWLVAIQDKKKGDVTLHRDFFNSLKTINPAIRTWGRVADILSIQVQIALRVKEGRSFLKQTPGLSADENNYGTQVLNNLLGASLENIDQLLIITTNNHYEMNDEQRIKRIEDLYLDAQSQYGFVSNFCSELKLLSLQRVNEKKEIELSRILSK